MQSIFFENVHLFQTVYSLETEDCWITETQTSKMEMFREREEESVNYVNNISRLIRQREREMILETIREIQEERERQEEIDRKLQEVSILGVESLLPFSA